MNRVLDIILFGATGFTGKYCISALHRLTKCDEYHLTWGIAGRSESKLRAALAESQEKIGGVNLEDVPVIIADTSNYGTLTAMTASARIIINCCGPYRFHGEPVIKACIDTGTHYVDVTGEPEFMELMQLKYNELAEEKGVYIVSSCGFDTIVAEMGIQFLQQHFDGGTLNSVETFLQRIINMKNPPNSTFNFGTWESAVHGFRNKQALQEIRSKLNQKRLPKCLPKLKLRNPNEKNDVIDGDYAVPLPSCDRSVVLRTNQYLFENKNYRPLQFQNYFAIKTRLGLFQLSIFAGIFNFLVQREYGRKLLLKFPEFFTNGVFTRAENLSHEKLDKTNFVFTLLGSGWDSNAPRLDNDPYNFKGLPNKTICGAIEGSNPSYGLASDAAVLSAVVILLECDKLPSGGGVYTPGAAFIDTSLIERLKKNNVMKFTIKSKL